MDDNDTPEDNRDNAPADSEDSRDATAAPQARTPPVVGLGGSAGSIQALQAFFASVPAHTGLAYVVVLHLSGEHESTLAELLQRSTQMTVLQVQESQRFEPDTVYVIPPRKSLRAIDGYLQLAELPRGRYPHTAVDLFFRTLADTHGANAAAIVLSGVDGDGAIGIKRVKERGGLTIAQDPEEAQYGGMPRAAVGTGMVDWVLPVEQMADRVLTYFRLAQQIKLPPEQGPQPAQMPQQPGSADEAALRDVLTFLRTRTGRDFSYYKRATILRRIGRRMQVNGIEDLPGYLTCLRTRPGEAGALLQDLLISVTNFFRDANCFTALEGNLPRLFQNKTSGDSLRVWVAACATGEEAYSIAMMLSEHARTLESAPQIQIFATDLDEDAIRTAREGIYPATIEADVSEERLRRFFVKEHRGYRVRRELREMVLFAVHDVLKDSPFSRLELVACRNLLIYLNRDAQARALETFHFALGPGGLLFLGSSESVEDGSALFSVLDKKHRIYVHRSTPRIGLPVAPGPGTLAIALEAQQSARATSPVTVAGPAFAQAAITARPGAALDGRATSWGELHFKLLEHLASPSLLVDAEHDIVHLSPSAGRFLQYGGGEPSRNLLRAIHPGLRIELRAALYQAAQAEAPIDVPPVPVDLNGAPLSVAMTVTPVPDIAPGLLLVTLRAAATPGELARPGEEGAEATESVPLAHHLDRELERLKAHLRDTVEQYEASTEELKASNEELQAMNEELRSATEELETSREELQSINEELTTVNHELKNKVDELGHSNSDMQNLMDATAIATVFLDREMRITRYTPSAVALFNLIPTDVGRPLTDLTSQLDYAGLGDDAQRVLDRLVPVEREVSEAGGNWYLARTLPYRTLDDRIAGVVLTFVDITERKRGQEALRRSEERFSAIVNQAAVGVVQVSPGGRVTFANQCCQELLGYSDGELNGSILLDAVHAPDRAATERLLEGLMRDGEHFRTESRWLRKDGSVIWMHISGNSLLNPDGQPSSILVGTDITERKRAEEALRRSEEHLRLIIENAVEYAIFSTDRERRVTTWSAGARRMLGYAEDEVLGQRYDIIFTDEDRTAGVPQHETEKAEREGSATEDGFRLRKNGERFWASGALTPMRDASGQVVGFVKVLRDQTDVRTAHEALERSRAELIAALDQQQRIGAELEAANTQKDRFIAVLSHELRNPLAAIGSAAQALQLGALKAKVRTRASQIVLRQTNVMRLLLDDLLDVSRLRLGKLALTLQPVPIGTVVNMALESSRGTIEGAGQHLTVGIPDRTLLVDADPMRLAQVLSNLLGNAAKYTPGGGHIELKAEVRGDSLALSVTDDGAGMSPETVGSMFEMFWQRSIADQAEQAERGRSGLGIGLALARSLVALHDGTISGASDGLGKGSRFTVVLPLSRAAAPAPTAVVAPRPSDVPAPPLKILIGDDNTDTAWSIAQLLKLSGHELQVAYSGAEALRLAGEWRPDVAVLDIDLPDLSGYDIARRIRTEPWGRAMLLVAATGWAQADDARTAVGAGFDTHLAKPVDMSALEALLQQHAVNGAGGSA
jgi:two-component system CheB/CheR fusion protein